MKNLDLLLVIRGILSIQVIIWHIWGYEGNILPIINTPGRTAVILFFGLSGYVISHGFLTEKYSFSIDDLKIFYQRRVYRIVPLFLLISSITLLYGYFSENNFMIPEERILAELLMIQFNHSYSLNSVFWTLGIEMQFYLLAPFIIFITMNLTNNLIQQLIFLGTIFIIYIMGVYFFGIDNRNLLENLFHFLVGIITCQYFQKNDIPKISNSKLFLIIIFLITTSNYIYHNSGTLYYSFGIILINLCIPMMVLSHLNVNRLNAKRVKRFPPFLLTLGTISYGIYAWHPLIIKLVEKFQTIHVSLSFVFTLGIAYLSYNLFEKPILSYASRK